MIANIYRSRAPFRMHPGAIRDTTVAAKQIDVRVQSGLSSTKETAVQQNAIIPRSVEQEDNEETERHPLDSPDFETEEGTEGGESSLTEEIMEMHLECFGVELSQVR